MESNYERPAFLKMVEKAKEHIQNGDAIQVVLSQQFQLKTLVPAFEIYRSLRR